MRYNAAKFQFRSASVSYCGHMFTSAGLRPDPEKIKTVQDNNNPKCVKDVQRFLGLVNYMSRFLLKLTDMAAPLRQLTAKGTEWMWESSQVAAVKEIKDTIVKDMVLKYYD